jgi:F-type H+-transporting ATPase subunit b
VLPGLSVIGVIIIVLLLTLVLSRGFFAPITRVLRERDAAITSANDIAQTSAAKAAAAAAEFERRTRVAQAEVYRAMDETRRQALQGRSELLAQTRQDVDRTLADATARLQAQVAEARAALAQDADALADAVVERVLGRRAS